MVDGWPGRVARDNWGPTMETEKRQIDPRNSLNDKQVNLEFWNMAGLSLCAPKGVMLFADDEGLAFFSGFFAWDDTLFTGFNEPSFLTFTTNAPGDYTLQFANQVLGRPDDETGIAQLESLDFQFGVGDMNDFNIQRVFVEITLSDPQTFQIKTRRAAGLVQENFALAVW